MLQDRRANRPAPGTAVVTGKSLSSEHTGAFFAGPDPDPPRPQRLQIPVNDLAGADAASGA
jgi:hypothetical protein